MVVNGPSIEKEMPCWVEAGRWGRQKSLTHKKPNQAVHKAHKQSIDRDGGVQRRANQHSKILSDRNMGQADRDLQRLETKHVFTARGGKQRITVTQYAVNVRCTSSSSRCDRILMRPGVP